MNVCALFFFFFRFVGFYCFDAFWVSIFFSFVCNISPLYWWQYDLLFWCVYLIYHLNQLAYNINFKCKKVKKKSLKSAYICVLCTLYKQSLFVFRISSTAQYFLFQRFALLSCTCSCICTLQYVTGLCFHSILPVLY